jgi:hypothetical protein
MKALRQKFGINENMTHVEKGLPEEVIPDLAEHLQAGFWARSDAPVFQQHSSATRRNR